MSVIKANYVFSGPDHGWRETWYFQQTSEALDVALATFQSTVASRRVLLGAQASIKAIEVSVELNNLGQPVLNDSLISYVFQNGFTSEDCADLDLAVLTNCGNAGRTRHRNIFLRGFWDSIEVQGGKYVPPPGSTWQTKYDSWKGLMSSLGMGYLQSNKTGPTSITDYIQLAGGQVQLTFGAAMGWDFSPTAKNVQIRVNTNRQPSALSGLLLVLPLTATTAQTVDKISVFPFTGSGWKAFQYTKSFVVTPNIDAQRIARRAVGRPLLVSRGRSRARARG